MVHSKIMIKSKNRISWDKEKIESLKENYHHGRAYCAKLFGCSIRAIKHVTKKYNILLRPSFQKFTEEEILYIKDNYPYKTSKEISEIINRPEQSIHVIAKQNKIEKF